MQNRIIIFIENGQTAWLIQDAAGQIIQCVRKGELSQLHPGETDEIGVVVPAESILLTQVDLPRMNAYRLQQALPFALEEKVLDDLEDLHFAAATASEGRLPVAIVKKSKLDEWLALLQNHHLRPDWLTSAVFTLPYEENQWSLRILNDSATVRTGLYAGFSAELSNLDLLLDLKCEEREIPPVKGRVYRSKKQAFSLVSKALPLETVNQSAEEVLEQGAKVLEKHPPLNLLQGQYALKRPLRASPKNKRAFRLAGFALTLWLGLLLFSKLGSWLILSWEHHHLQSSVARVYKAHFKEGSLSANPKRQLETELKKALAQNNRNRLFQWLSDLSKVNASGRLQAFSFQNAQLVLEWTAPSFTALDDFILALKSQGIEVRQQSAVLTGNQVKASLLIEGPSS